MFQRLMLLALIGTMFPAFAMADSSVYRWTDENGVTHFGDRQPMGRPAEKVNVKTGQPSSAPERSSAVEQVEALDERQQERARQENESAVEEARRKQREANCNTARANIEVISSHARIRVTESGEQRYLSPEEVQEKRKQFEEIAAENCGKQDAQQ